MNEIVIDTINHDGFYTKANIEGDKAKLIINDLIINMTQKQMLTLYRELGIIVVRDRILRKKEALQHDTINKGEYSQD